MVKELKCMRRKMTFKRITFYFMRNTPGCTSHYYHKLIEIIGPEKYLNSPILRNEWNSARNSFDKMYGIVSILCKHYDTFISKSYVTDDVQNYLNTLFQKELNSLKHCCDGIQKDLYSFIRGADDEESKQSFESFIKIKNIIYDLEYETKHKTETDLFQLVKNTEKVLRIYEQITKFANSEKDFAIKKLKESNNPDNKEEEKKNELSADIQTDSTNTTDTLSA